MEWPQWYAGIGSHDTRKEVFENGRNNPPGGEPYGIVTWADVLAEAADPLEVEKAAGVWLIPSEYHDHDARSHGAQRARGRFRAL